MKKDQKAPVLLAGETREIFLAELERTGLVTRAADKALVTRTTVYRRLSMDPEFKEAFETARERYREALIAEAEFRARGYEVPVFHQGLETGAKKPVYSERLLELLLKARVPEFRDRLQVEATVAVGVMVVPAVAESAEDWRAGANQKVDAPHRTEDTR